MASPPDHHGASDGPSRWFQVVELSSARRARTYLTRESDALDLAVHLVGTGAPIVVVESWEDGRPVDLRLIRRDRWPARVDEGDPLLLDPRQATP